MTREASNEKLDVDVRLHVYHTLADTGAAPTTAATARALDISELEAANAYERLAAGRALVLHPRTRELVMAPPLSAVATGFRVETARRAHWGNCIWDALGVLAMLRTDGSVGTSCGDCQAPMRVEVAAQQVSGNGVVHFALPVRRWWEDVIFT